MDCISPDHVETELSETFIRVSLSGIRAAIPFDANDTEESHDEKFLAAVELFHSLKSRNADEAALATRYVISHVRYLHLSARAAAADQADDKVVVRLNAAASTADRLASTTRRAIRDAQKPAPGPAAASRKQAARPSWADPQSTIAHDDMGPFDDPTLGPLPPGTDGWIRLAPGARPIPHYSRFQPRDAAGAPIPFHRRDLMTMAQRRAALASPRDPDLEAVAIAEEEQMIAAHAAQPVAATADP